MWALQAITTALLSGLFSGLILFGLNERRDRLDALIEKAEQSVEAFAEWCDLYVKYNQSFFDIATGAKTERQHFDESSDLQARIDRLFAKVQMLIRFYFPDRFDLVVAVSTTQVEAYPIIGEIRRQKAVDTGLIDPKLFDQLTEVSKGLIEMKKAAMARLSEDAMRLVHRPFLLDSWGWRSVAKKLSASR